MPESRPRTAILCDADRWSLRMMEPLLAEAGYEVLSQAGTAVDALRLCELLHPSLVVIAHELAGLSGTEAVRDLRALPGTPEVVVISSSTDVGTAVTAAGAFGAAPRGDAEALARLLDEVGHLLDTGERRNRGDRRSGVDRRQHQDWSKVTHERRSGEDRRQGPRREAEASEPAAADGSDDPASASADAGTPGVTLTGSTTADVVEGTSSDEGMRPDEGAAPLPRRHDAGTGG